MPSPLLVAYFIVMADQHRQQLHVQQLLTRIQELEAKEAQLDIEVVEWRRRKCNAMDEVGRLVEHCSDLVGPFFKRMERLPSRAFRKFQLRGPKAPCDDDICLWCTAREK